MAPPTSTTDDYPGAALARAATMELPGTTINEHYDFEEYIARRGAFLSRQPQFAHYFNSCWIARKHAAEVFDHEKQRLSVQEVRRREVRMRQDPLLPLPTTTNTQTIDGLASYPADEFPSELVEDVPGGEGNAGSTVKEARRRGDSVLADDGVAAFTSPKVRLPETPPPYTPSPRAALDSSTLTTASPHVDGFSSVQDIDVQEEKIWPDISVPDLDQEARVQPPNNAGRPMKTAVNGEDQKMVQEASVYEIFLPNREDQAAVHSTTNTEHTAKASPEVQIQGAPQEQPIHEISTPGRNEQVATKPTTSAEHPVKVIPNGKDHENPQEQSIPEISMPDRDEQVTAQPETNAEHLANTVTVQTQTTQKQDTLPRISFPEPAQHSTTQPAVINDNRTTPTASKVITKPSNKITPPTTSPTGRTFSVSPGVSALRGRGISVPVKKHGRQTPEPQDNVDDADAQTTADLDAASSPLPAKKARTTAPEPNKATTAMPPPAKKAKTMAPQPAKAAPIEAPKPRATKTVPQEPVPTAPKPLAASYLPKGIARSVTRSAANTRKPPATTEPAATTRNAGHIEAVVNGRALPKNAAEAKQAAKTRHGKLLAKFPDISGRGGRRAKAAKPDLMPEFFEKSSFPKGMEKDCVRCICGTKEDDGVLMVSCGTCMVWQHAICMLPGTTEKEASEMEYHCQVCDPFERREVVQKLRRENSL